MLAGAGLGRELEERRARLLQTKQLLLRTSRYSAVTVGSEDREEDQVNRRTGQHFSPGHLAVPT